MSLLCTAKPRRTHLIRIHGSWIVGKPGDPWLKPTQTSRTLQPWTAAGEGRREGLTRSMLEEALSAVEDLVKGTHLQMCSFVVTHTAKSVCQTQGSAFTDDACISLGCCCEWLCWKMSRCILHGSSSVCPLMVEPHKDSSDSEVNRQAHVCNVKHLFQWWCFLGGGGGVIYTCLWIRWYIYCKPCIACIWQMVRRWLDPSTLAVLTL